MKKAFVLAMIFALVAVLGVGAAGCKPKKPAETPTQTGSTVQPAHGATTAAAAPAAAPGVTPEVYWQIQLERQEAMKQYLTDTLAIYKKYNGATPEARNDLMGLEKGHQEKMQSILTSHGLNSTADLMPNEPGRQEALTARQQYMQEHPELRDKFMAMSTEMRDLKDKITAFTTGSTPAAGSTAPAAPAPAGGTPAPAAPAPGAAPAPVPVTPPPAAPVTPAPAPTPPPAAPAPAPAHTAPAHP